MPVDGWNVTFVRQQEDWLECPPVHASLYCNRYKNVNNSFIKDRSVFDLPRGGRKGFGEFNPPLVEDDPSLVTVKFGLGDRI